MYKILIFVLLIIGIATTGGGCGYTPASVGANISRNKSQDVNNSEVVKGINRLEVKKRIEEMVKAGIPPEKYIKRPFFVHVPLELREDYICPVCGKTTLYVPKEHIRLGDREEDETIKKVVVWRLGWCRRVIKKIKTQNVKLDESQFCRHCSPHTNKPLLGLIIQYPDSEKHHSIYGVDEEDCQMVLDFFDGLDVFIAWGDSHDYVIKFTQCLDRLEELLGVKVDIKE